MLKTVIAFIRLGRLKFLGGGILMYGLGVAAAAASGFSLNMETALPGLLLVLCSQLMTHYCNDYYDYEADCANATPTDWSGGSRVLPGGEVSLKTAFVAAVLLGLASVCLALYLFLKFGLPYSFLVLSAGIISISWFYSAPPLRLHSTGMGEIAAAFVVGVLWPLAGFFLQAQQYALTPLLAAIPCFLLQFLMLIMIEFPDEAGDAQAGKRTFLVRLSAARTARVYMFLLLMHFLALPMLVWLGLPAEAGLAMLFLLPVAAWQFAAMLQKHWREPRHWNKLAFRSVFLFAATALAQLLAFVYLYFQGETGP